MLAGMDDREDPEDLITMEAMSGLSRIFSKIDEGHVRPILINIALRIRPCFEKVCVDIHTRLYHKTPNKEWCSYIAHQHVVHGNGVPQSKM